MTLREGLLLSARRHAQAVVSYLEHDLSAVTVLEGERAAVLQAMGDLTYWGSPQWQATRTAFDAVGLNGSNYPPRVRCLCGVRVGLQAYQGLDANASTVMDTLYKVRDQLMPSSVAGQHFAGVWSDDTDRISALMLADDDLRANAAGLMQDLQPGLNALTAGDGASVTMTPELIDEMQGFLDQLKQADQADGGGQLAQGIAQEEQTVDLPSLEGQTFADVLAQLNERVAGSDSTNTTAGDPTSTTP